MYGDYMSVFEELLHDGDDKVRMERFRELFELMERHRHKNQYE